MQKEVNKYFQFVVFRASAAINMRAKRNVRTGAVYSIRKT